MRLVQAGEDGTELGTELVVQRNGLRLEHGHRAVSRPGGRGGLQADPAGPGHHHPRAPLERRTQPVGIAYRTQVEHLLAVGAGEGEAARRGTVGEQQPVVGHLPVATRPGGGHGGRATVDGRDGDALAQVHVVFGVPLGSVHVDRVTAVLAEQVALGQRRALVRTLRLGAQQHDLAVESLVAQRFGGLGPGQTRADNHKGRHAPRLRRAWRAEAVMPGDGRRVGERGHLVDDDPAVRGVGSGRVPGRAQ